MRILNSINYLVDRLICFLDGHIWEFYREFYTIPRLDMYMCAYCETRVFGKPKPRWWQNG